MSLINEALKKARVEAAQRDARQRGVLVPKAAAYGPRRRPGRIAAAVVAGGLALGLAAGGGMWLAGRQAPDPAGGEAAAPEAATAEPAEAPGTGVAGPTEAAGTTGAAGVAGGSETAPAAASGRTMVPSPPPADPARDPSERTRGAASNPAPPAGGDGPESAMPAAEPAEARPASAAPARPEPSPRAAQRPTRPAPTPPAPAAPGYVREAPLPGGGSLHLDGIAWSETAPAAVIDGQIVGPGERIRGALVVRIERDRVVLEAGDGEIVVRLR